MSLRLRDLGSPMEQRDHVITRLRNLVENQSRMIAKLSSHHSYRNSRDEKGGTRRRRQRFDPDPDDNNDDNDNYSVTSTSPSTSSSDDGEDTDNSVLHPTSHINHPPPTPYPSSSSSPSPRHIDTNNTGAGASGGGGAGSTRGAASLAATVMDLQERLETEQLKARRLENVQSSQFESELSETKLKLNRSSLRTQRQLQATMDRLRAELVNGQKVRLQLESKVADRSREVSSLTERYSHEKEKAAKLQIMVETQERSIWRMASQIEVGSPFSHLAEHATKPIVDSLKLRLDEMQGRLVISEKESRTANDKVHGLELQSSIQTERADMAETEHKKAKEQVEALRTELRETITKWENKLRDEVNKLKTEHAAEVHKLQKINLEEREAARRVLAETEASHESTRDLLAEEKRMGEDTMHKLSETEVKLTEADARVDNLEERLANAAAAAKKEYKDVVARLDEAVARNEAREDTFSRHWTASTFRTAVAAGDAASSLHRAAGGVERTYEL